MSKRYAEIKVYGERNSGTNFVEKTILRSYDIRIIWNIPDVPQERRKAIETCGLPILSARFLIERAWDDIYFEHRLKSRGWKHEKLSDDSLGEYDAAADGKCGFVFVVRNPFDWSRSMHRNPFHALQPVPEDFAAFIRSPWALVKRDCVDRDYLETPILLWKMKVAEYVRLASERRGLLIRYEDLLHKPNDGLAAFNTFLGADSSSLVFPEKSARSFIDDNRTFASFRSEYSLGTARRKTKSEDAAFIEDIIGRDLLLEVYREFRQEG